MSTRCSIPSVFPGLIAKYGLHIQLLTLVVSQENVVYYSRVLVVQTRQIFLQQFDVNHPS